jgi:hypothetical protein
VIREKNSILILTPNGVAVLVNLAEVVAWLSSKLHVYDIPLRKREMIMLAALFELRTQNRDMLFSATAAGVISCAKAPEYIDS